MSKTNNVKNIIDKGHIFYFEPNDNVYGKDQDGNNVSLMPYFEDMCVAMTLTADIYPRKKTSIESLSNSNNPNEGGMIRRCLSWISYVNRQGSESQQIVNGGTKLGDNNYLTTFYSEISADKYIENELVEGLGITSINIAFESWYTPTVTINFVDIHGSALWGRQEAMYESGEINADTLLGIFFTQPYPLFRLQIKGFLGHDVTYQLSVSGFKGRYNSQTGNFEATATFIGYNYSLLTDIPLKLLSYVSEMGYVGKSYWDSHVNDSKWQLVNEDGSTTPPIKLYQIIDGIRSAVRVLDGKDSKECDETPNGLQELESGAIDATAENRAVSLSEAAMVTNANNASNEIGAVEDALTLFINECKNAVGKDNLFIGKNGSKTPVEEQLFFIYKPNSDATKLKVNKKFSKTYQSFCKALDRYNSANSNNKIVNCIAEFESFHNIAYNISSSSTLRLNGTQILKLTSNKTLAFKTDSPNKITINGYKIYDDTASQLKKNIDNINAGYYITPQLISTTGQYGFILPLGDLRSRISEVKSKLRTVGTNTETRVETTIAASVEGTERVVSTERDASITDDIRTRKKKIIDLLGFEPTLGNFSKILMCHLETFIEVMMHCGDAIYNDAVNGKRIPSNFNLDLENTDISNNRSNGKSTANTEEAFIYPWPAFYNPKPKGKNDSTPSNAKYNALGWTNDYPPKSNADYEWEEQKVILSFMDAIQRYDETSEGHKVTTTYNNTGLPITGGDLGLSAPFSSVSAYCTDIEHLTPYLGLRIAKTIGVGDSNCTNDIATAIGYMDALNLLIHSADYDKLAKAVNSNSNDTNFESQVLSYLTCKSTSQSNGQSESGRNYNYFEFIREEGNPYCKEKAIRHPMFVKNNVGNYDYSYIFSNVNGKGKKYTSLIPAELNPISDNSIPYSYLFNKEKKDNKVTFTPTIGKKYNTGSRTGISQYYIYSDSSKNVAIDEKGKVYNDYTNEQLFYVLENESYTQDFPKYIEKFKKGEVRFKSYDITNDELLTKFFNRRYKVSNENYYQFFVNDRHARVLMPLVSKADNNYSNSHLCLDKAKLSSVSFDTQWSTDKNSSLYNATNLTIDTKNGNFKNGENTYSADEVFIGELPILINSDIRGSLFGSKLFYQQGNNKKAKAYLLLTSMMSGITNFNSTLFKVEGYSIIEQLPPFYILFLGALMWRAGKASEPLKLDGYTNTSPDKETSFITQKNYILQLDTKQKLKWFTIEDYYMPYNKIDLVVKNKLVNMFKEFCNSAELQTILDAYELRDSSGQVLNSTSWNSVMNKWSVNDFDSKSPTSWETILDGVTKNYASIALPNGNKTILRLLFDENSDAQYWLKKIYGVKGGYIVGRSTSKHVGQGEGQVTISKSQILSYLTGFKKRIDEAKKTSTQKLVEESALSATEVSRDYAVSLYYSLKQLWDTWLITAARDQFTIENFFNKYFIFIDSFYMNTYNKIKLNCEKILNAYDSDKNGKKSLLTFLDEIAKDQNCILFALPSFFDSNNLECGKSDVASYHNLNDTEWKKDYLCKMFTPLAFNDMGAPKLANSFVFMYTHQLSSNASEANDKNYDSYIITDEGSVPSQLQLAVLTNGNDDSSSGNLNSSNNNSTDDRALVSARESYTMPIFGVTVNRGNNYIFKNINVNMDSPIITAVAAQTMEDLLTKYGSDNSKRVFFHGQDIYSIYSKYSYECEIEMMGCAQIQPLMYFQLFNMPMWNGMYMIMKVTHTMQAGMMTTKFTGIKMSKLETPYASGYYVENKKTSEADKKKEEEKKTIPSLSECNDNAYDGILQIKNVIGGEKMIQAIFGGYTGYRLPTYGTQTFGYQRSLNRKHWGLDIGVSNGTKLYSPWDGKITEAHPIMDKNEGGIRLSIVDNSGQYKVKFFHCSKILKRDGDTVKAGDLVAYSGNTSAVGKSLYSPHLHLELFINGNFNLRQQVDPTRFFGYLA